MKTKFDEAWSYDILRAIRWPKGIVCPYCQQTRVTTHTKSTATPRQRYLCLICRRTFSDLTGTPFARTNLPLRTWFLSLQLMGDILMTSELAKALGVKWDTAAYIQRRLAAALNHHRLIRQLRGTLEEARYE